MSIIYVSPTPQDSVAPKNHLLFVMILWVRIGNRLMGTAPLLHARPWSHCHAWNSAGAEHGRPPRAPGLWCCVSQPRVSSVGLPLRVSLSFLTARLPGSKTVKAEAARPGQGEPGTDAAPFPYTPVAQGSCQTSPSLRMGREEGHSGRGAWGTEGEELLAAVIGDVFAGPPTPSHIMPPRHAPAAFPSPQVLTQSFQSSGQSSSSITRPGGPTWKPAGGPRLPSARLSAKSASLASLSRTAAH